MIDTELLQNKILYLMTKSDKCIKTAAQSKSLLKLMDGDEVSISITKAFLEWFNTYKTIPSRRIIHDNLQTTNLGPQIHMRLKVISDLGKAEAIPEENEFEAYVDQLKMSWMHEKFTETLNTYTSIDRSKITSVPELAKSIKGFANQFLKVSDSVTANDEGEYSYTTSNAAENIENIKNKDISKEPRFKIGHRKLDNETGGFRYGDFVIVLGNVNQGKSMVISNMVYNLWRNGANVLLLTAEHRASEFDERIYSRASNVDYKSIMTGKDALTEADKTALDVCVKNMTSTPNKIITKFLRNSDYVGAIEGYLEDLRLKSDFIPDVIMVDSLEKITPQNEIVEEKDNLKVAQIAKEFKNFAQTFMNGRGVVVISTHQAKTVTLEKHFEDINVADFGRSKVVAEEPDFAIYIRSKAEFNLMNVKLVKARRTAAELTWNMAIDFSKCLVMDTDESLNSGMLPDD